MAKQGKKMPKKYRQAKAAAKPAAEAAFPGKKKAGRRDPMAKYSAEDRELFKELKEESKRGYLTTDKGEKVFVKPDETAKERIRRERAEALRKFREEADMDEDKSKSRAERMKSKREEVMKRNEAAKAERKGKRAPGLMQAATEPKKQTTKVPAKKAAAAPVKKETGNKLNKSKKTFGEISKAVAKADAKPSASKKTKVYSITNVQPEKATKGAVKPKFVQKKAPAMSKSEMKAQSRKALDKIEKDVKANAAKPSTSKAVAIRPKGAVATTAKKAATTAAKKGGVVGALKGAGRLAGKAVGGRVGLALAAGAAIAGPVHKALSKDTKGRTTFDMLQKRADAVVAADKAAKGKTPGPEARSNQPRVTGQGRFVGAGGATTKVGSSYTVKKGDTLSGIAKNAGVSLADIRKANPQLMTNKKYKQGSAIWSGTKVRIPKK